MGDFVICDIDEDLLKKIKKFKMRKEKNIAAIIMKINVEKHLIVVDEELEDTSIEEFQESLPTHQPSYSLVSYVHKHDDGRVSYPYFFIYVAPRGCKPELQMMYAGSKLNIIKMSGATKDFEVRSVDEIDEDWLKEKLRFFR
ncbi:glia maturation factor beta-like [Dendronephthya gigantea]|uniref:glia maturation factor beta-like n=1 Tax=Dendronephthya gigantea TaxID=151771 RepID=UPI00106A726A|nr:glia maturation factor beta-like [Dendronephthya gigantea]